MMKTGGKKKGVIEGIQQDTIRPGSGSENPHDW